MNAGKEGSALARPAAVLSDALQQAVLSSQPQSVQDFWQWSSVRCGCLGRNTKYCKLRISPSNSTSTPRRHDGFFFFRKFSVLSVEAPVFCFRRVFIAYYRVSCYIIFFPFLRVSILSLVRVLIGLFLPLSLIWPHLFRKQEFNQEVFFERRASLGNPHPVSN